MKNYLLLLLIIVVSFSCNKEADVQKEVVYINNSPSEQTLVTAKDYNTFGQVVSAISNDDLSKKDGLLKLKDIINKDTQNTNQELENKNQDTFSKYNKKQFDEAQENNIKLMFLNRDSIKKQLLNLTIVLGIDYKINTQTEAKSEQELTNVLRRFFFHLNHRETKFTKGPIPYKKMVYLLSFVEQVKRKYESSSSNGFRSAEFLKFIRLQMKRDKLDSELLMIKYASLSDLINDDSDLFSLFMPIAKSISLHKQSSYREHKLFIRLLTFLTNHDDENLFNTFDIEILKQIAQSAHYSALWSIQTLTNLRLHKNEFNQQLQYLSNTFYFFDNYLALSSQIPHEEFIKLIDARFYEVEVSLSRLFQKNKAAIDKQLYIYQIKDMHPILAMNFLENSITAPLNKKQIALNNFYEKVYNGLDVSESIFRGFDFKKEIENSKRKYIYSLYQTIFTKVFIKIKKLNKSNDINNLESEIRNDLILLKRNFVNALHLRTEKDLTAIKGINENKVMDSKSFKLTDDSYSTLCNIRFDLLEEYDYLEEDCKTDILLPGIHKNSKYLIITNKNIYAHPLALLYSPSEDIVITSKKLENLWIDTSGQNSSALNLNHIPYYGKRPEQGLTVTRSSVGVQWYNYYFGITEGSAPNKAANGIAGLDSGSLRLSGVNYLENIFITALGGKGAQGETAYNTPLCSKDNVYTSWTGHHGHIHWASFDRRSAVSYVGKQARVISSGISGDGGHGGNGGDLYAYKINEQNLFKIKASYINFEGLAGAAGNSPLCTTPSEKNDLEKLRGIDGNLGMKGSFSHE